jgi:predicted nucleic acid-binding Zn ribbon protein
MKLSRAGNAIQALVLRIAGADNQDLVAIAWSWRRIVGSLLADRTEIVKMENKILFIAVNNSVWMQELILQKYRIIGAIRRKTGVTLSDIIFFIKTRQGMK